MELTACTREDSGACNGGIVQGNIEGPIRNEPQKAKYRSQPSSFLCGQGVQL
jgi:hypothetical protein